MMRSTFYKDHYGSNLEDRKAVKQNDRKAMELTRAKGGQGLNSGERSRGD